MTCTCFADPFHLSNCSFSCLPTNPPAPPRTHAVKDCGHTAYVCPHARRANVHTCTYLHVCAHATYLSLVCMPLRPAWVNRVCTRVAGVHVFAAHAAGARPTRNVLRNSAGSFERGVFAAQIFRRRLVAGRVREARTDARGKELEVVSELLQNDVLAQVVLPAALPAHRTALQQLHRPGTCARGCRCVRSHWSGALGSVQQGRQPAGPTALRRHALVGGAATSVRARRPGAGCTGAPQACSPSDAQRAEAVPAGEHDRRLEALLAQLTLQRQLQLAKFLVHDQLRHFRLHPPHLPLPPLSHASLRFPPEAPRRVRE